MGFPIDTTLLPTAESLNGSWRIDVPFTLTTLGHLLDPGDTERLREMSAMSGQPVLTFGENGNFTVREQMGPEIDYDTGSWTFVTAENNTAALQMSDLQWDPDDVQLWFLDQKLCIPQLETDELLLFVRRLPR